MNVQHVMRQMADDPTLVEQMKEDPQKTLKTLAPLASDVTIYRIVVLSLGGTVLISMIGSLVLAFWGKTIPDVVSLLGGTAIGAIGGLLARPPQS